MWRTIKRDIESAARTKSGLWLLKTLFLSPGLSAVILFRFQDTLYRLKLLPLSYLVYRANLGLHGIDILPGAIIGYGLRIDHPVGVVIGAGSQIGNNCVILQNVTIGTRYLDLNKFNNEFPQIGNSVIIGAGAVILGGIKVGGGSTIGANAIVLADVEAETTVTGVHT